MNQSEFLELKESVVQRGEIQVQILTDSMEPIIKAGEWVTCVPLDQDLAIFDILVFYSNQKLFCHFLFKRKSALHDRSQTMLVTGSYKYQGLDAPVPREMILGRITSHRIGFLRKLFFTLKLLVKSELKTTYG
jgi:hypothetical protein